MKPRAKRGFFAFCNWGGAVCSILELANPGFPMPRKCAPREKCGDLIVRWMRIDVVRILAVADINDRQVRLNAAWPNIPKH